MHLIDTWCVFYFDVSFWQPTFSTEHFLDIYTSQNNTCQFTIHHRHLTGIFITKQFLPFFNLVPLGSKCSPIWTLLFIYLFMVFTLFYGYLHFHLEKVCTILTQTCILCATLLCVMVCHRHKECMVPTPFVSVAYRVAEDTAPFDPIHLAFLYIGHSGTYKFLDRTFIPLSLRICKR